MQYKQKDPAFLFYTSDFYTGVAGMTMEERGQYITLLCIQHQQGHLTEKIICLTLGVKSIKEIPYIIEKFNVDENGLYYNSRLEIETTKRDNFCKSRQKSIESRWKNKK